MKYLCISLLVLWGVVPLLGHHYAFYKAIFEAIDQRDLESAKHLFSEGAWKGQASDVSGVDVSKRLKDSKSFSFSKITEGGEHYRRVNIKKKKH